jgi:hypothetical protein
VQDRTPQPENHAGLSRRAALAQLSLVCAGLAVACTPVRFLLHDYPREVDLDGDLTSAVLLAFALTVIPGAPADDPNLIRAYGDSRLPFARFRIFFAGDLCRRAQEQFGAPNFVALTEPQRIRVIQAGLDGDAGSRRLYQGAITLTQVAFYAGIYDDRAGCAMIGFDGAYRFANRDRLSYNDPEDLVPAGTTPDGNPT